MKKIIVALIAILMLGLPVAAAQEAEAELSDAGTTPDSALYGLDKAFERISLAMTFDKAAKAEKRLKIASERIAELKAMTEKGKPEFNEKLMEESEKEMDDAVKDVEEAEAKGKDMSAVKAHVTEMQSKHIAVLQRVLEKAPESAKAALQRVIEKAQVKQEQRATGLKQKAPKPEGAEETPEGAGMKPENAGKPADAGNEMNQEKIGKPDAVQDSEVPEQGAEDSM